MDDGISDAVTAHRDLVRSLMAPGQPLAVDSPHATIEQSQWFKKSGAARSERRELHSRLLGEVRDAHPDVAFERQAMVLAGPPGAGKSTVLRGLLGEDAKRWLVIDPDEFKRSLLRQAIVDGTYDALIKPPQIRELETTQGERFAPLELAALVHEESSLLAKQLRQDATAQGANIVIDTVLSKDAGAVALGEQLAAAGYTVRVVDVECSYDVSAARVEHRWREVTRAYLENPASDSLGGRWVPSEYARSLFPEELGGASLSEGAARTLAEQCSAVTRYEVHRVTDPAASPVLEHALERPRVGGPLVDPAVARTASRLAAGNAMGSGASPQGTTAARPRGPRTPQPGIER